MLRSLVTTTVVAWIFINCCESARILGVFPNPMISHQVVFRKLTVELSKRGHEIVVFTANPVNDKNLKNYTEIDLRRNYNTINFFESRGDIYEFIGKLSVLGESAVDEVLARPEMQSMISPESNEHFDLILLEFSYYEAFFGLMDRFDAPVVAITTLPLEANGHHVIGNPMALAYSPGVFDPYTADELNFWGRLRNAYRNLRQQLVHYYDGYPRQDRLLKKYFGPNTPFIGDLISNVSIVLVNSYTALGYPRPNLPCIIEIGGLALDTELKGLEPTLRKFLDDAVHGFVYFSLGSNAKSEQLPLDKLEILKNALAELPYRVLWKWELDAFPGKPDNVFISRWLPQYDVLAHPNIKAFVYQGGLQSTEEGISGGVPLIGIPISSDQDFNVRKLVSLGIAKRLDFDKLTKDDIKNAILEIATDASYKHTVEKLRALINDQPQTAVERAVWWVEYVVRHKGATHLNTRVRLQPWFQRELLDIMTFVAALVITNFFILYKLTRFTVKMSSHIFTSMNRKKMKIK